jgi:hypothetical protein
VPAHRPWFLNTIFQLKKLGLFGDMVNSRPVTEKIPFGKSFGNAQKT